MLRSLRTVLAGVSLLGASSVAQAEMRLFMFEIADCAACDRFHAEALQEYWNSEASRTLPLTIVDLNTLGTAAQPLRSPIDVVPTFVVMRDGREVARLSGYPGRQAFEAGIRGCAVRRSADGLDPTVAIGHQALHGLRPRCLPLAISLLPPIYRDP